MFHFVFDLYKIYRSFLMPNPGPVGGSINEVKPDLGSAAKRPLRGPAAGFFPAFKSSRILFISAGVKSS